MKCNVGTRSEDRNNNDKRSQTKTGYHMLRHMKADTGSYKITSQERIACNAFDEKLFDKS